MIAVAKVIPSLQADEVLFLLRFACPCNYEYGLAKEKAAGLNSGDLRHIVAEHTGQSSQLFSVTTGRNAQFLATVARSTLVRQVDSS